MPNFNIELKSKIKKTYRVARVSSDFDLDIEEVKECIIGSLPFEKKEWGKGLIIGSSGTGKTSIGRYLFNKKIENKIFESDRSIIDEMPKEKKFEEIIKIFYSVGFGSAPSWLKPYNVLSNGEKMRVDLAFKLLSDDELIIFDEFTSVVDREVAKTSCIAISKALEKTNKKFIGIGCHYDVADWLEADWIFDTNTMKFSSLKKNEKNGNLRLKNVEKKNGISLKSIII